MANLITLDDYKTAKKITGFGDDVRLEELVTSVSQLVKTYCNSTIIDFHGTNKVESFNIDYGVHLISIEESPLNVLYPFRKEILSLQPIKLLQIT